MRKALLCRCHNSHADPDVGSQEWLGQSSKALLGPGWQGSPGGTSRRESCTAFLMTVEHRLAWPLQLPSWVPCRDVLLLLPSRIPSSCRLPAYQAWPHSHTVCARVVSESVIVIYSTLLSPAAFLSLPPSPFLFCYRDWAAVPQQSPLGRVFEGDCG